MKTLKINKTNCFKIITDFPKMSIINKNIPEVKMSVREIDNLFNRGLEMMKKGNYQEAETFFEKAKNMTLELQKK